MGKSKSFTTTDKISFVLLAVALGIFATAQALLQNPNADAFFLIDTGRYIVNNKALPDTAYWLIKPDVPTIIQQWLCDVFNYAAYAAGGYTGIVILGIIFNAFLLFCLFIYCREILKDNQVGFNAAVFCWILLCGFATTRPYSVTISVSLLELTLLHRFFAKEKHTKKETLTFFGLIVLIFVFQANWQASNILYPILWILCYVPVIKAKRFKIDLYALAALVIGALFSVVSPLGIRGPMFLTYARGSLERFNIIEVLPPHFPSLYTVMQAIVIALFIYAVVMKKLTSAQFFMTVGCFAMSCMFMRCCWTLVIPIGALVVNLKFTERSHRMMRWAYVAAGTLSILLLLKYNMEKSDDRESMLQSLPAPDEVTLYTDFNSGNYFLVDGYKIYYDARPELYDYRIAGDKAFLDEAYAAWAGNLDYAEFIDSYGFDWFAVSQNMPMDTYLAENDDYELVFVNQTDEINLYKRI
ncbi:MAG: hypothetical protein J5776_05110 [Clostridiales bacterium]|nr:hypothetical protein [Clostridiales bacterium]